MFLVYSLFFSDAHVSHSYTLCIFMIVLSINNNNILVLLLDEEDFIVTKLKQKKPIDKIG